MSTEEYQQLAKSSESFHKMDALWQQRILNAHSAEREIYIRNFLAEKKEVTGLKKKLVQITVEDLKKAQEQGNKLPSLIMKNLESETQITEKESANKLLKSLNKF